MIELRSFVYNTCRIIDNDISNKTYEDYVNVNIGGQDKSYKISSLYSDTAIGKIIPCNFILEHNNLKLTEEYYPLETTTIKNIISLIKDMNTSGVAISFKIAEPDYIKRKSNMLKMMRPGSVTKLATFDNVEPLTVIKVDNNLTIFSAIPIKLPPKCTRLFAMLKLNKLDIECVDTYGCINFDKMFYMSIIKTLKLPSKFIESTITSTVGTFQYLDTNTVDLSNSNPINILSINQMFDNAHIENLILGRFNTANCKEFNEAFSNLHTRVLDIRSMNFCGATEIDKLFSGIKVDELYVGDIINTNEHTKTQSQNWFNYSEINKIYSESQSIHEIFAIDNL